MDFISLFSGIAGFDLGLESAGHRCVAQVEIDQSASGVLQSHYPHIPRFTDVKEVGGHNLPPADLICGGFPCQDLSVAGQRKGLAGERSGLWFEFRRVISECAPRWVLIENVPGLLSSNGGADFAVLLRGLVELGYGVAWRVLDAQYFNLAQRRERVFIVGCLGDWADPLEVLFEPESCSGDSPPSRQAGTRVAPLTANGAGAGVGADASDALAGHLIPDVTGPLVKGSGHSQSTATGQDAKSGMLVPVITHTLKAEGHDASEDGTGRGVPLTVFRKAMKPHDPEEAERWEEDEVAGTLNAFDGERANPPSHIVAQAVSLRGRDGGNMPELENRTQEGRIAHALGVRRLTPTEYERLQGFPDGWTAVGGQKDSPRYKQLGNAVAVPVIAWIGRRLAAVQAAKEVAA